jgi:hypothetical protein
MVNIQTPLCWRETADGAGPIIQTKGESLAADERYSLIVPAK